MIELVFDPDSLHDGAESIIVKDADGYIESRIAIDRAKNDPNFTIKIIVTRPSLINYYMDLKPIEGWLTIYNYSIEDAIRDREIDVDLNNLSMGQLESLLPYKLDLLDFLESYDKALGQRENLLIYLFEDGQNLIGINEEKAFIDWIEAMLEKGQVEWIDYNKRGLLEEIASEYVGAKLLDKLLTVNTKEDFEKTKTSLVANYLFSTYGNASRNIIKERMDIFEDIQVPAELAVYLINKDPGLLIDINLILSEVKSKISFYEERSLDSFLNRTKGYLDPELDWIWRHIRDNFHQEYRQQIDQIYFWAKDMTFKSKLETLIDLLDFEHVKEEFGKPQTIEEWFQYYSEIHLKWFSPMSEEENIIYRLKSLDQDFLNPFIQALDDYKNKMESQYQDFLYNNYPELIRKDYTNLKVIDKVQPYIGQSKIFFFVIDGLKYELWDSIKNSLQEAGYLAENEEEKCLSILPSVTSISRTGLLSGKDYKTIIDGKYEERYKFGIHNEEKHLKENFSGYSIIYKKGGIDLMDDLFKEDADIYALIYSELDSILHASSSLARNLIQEQLKQAIETLVDRLDKEENVLLLIATDHGSTLNKGKEKLNLDYAKTVEIDQGGNYLLLKDKEIDQRTYQYIKENTPEDKWYTIWREDAAKYRLPKNLANRQIYGWIFPKHGYCYGHSSSSYNHGGLSMEETIIPYGLFRKKPNEFKNIRMTFQYKLINQGLSYIDIILYNPNLFSIKRLDLFLVVMDIRESFDNFQAKGKKRIRLNFNLEDYSSKKKIFQDQLEIRSKYLDKEDIQIVKIEEYIEETTVGAINKEIASGRRLDF